MTTPSKTYTIYFEVNVNNIDKICKNTQSEKKFWGYDQGIYQNQYGNAIGYAPGYYFASGTLGDGSHGDTLQCPMSANTEYPTNDPTLFNICYDGTVSSVDTSLDKYPIVGYRYDKNYTYNERSGTLPLTSFPIPNNSFNRGWIDVVGSDNILYKCPTCTNIGHTGAPENAGNSEQTYMYSYATWAEGDGSTIYTYTDFAGQTTEQTVKCNCYGEECENWFPPRDSGFPVQGWVNGLYGCIWFNEQYGNVQYGARTISSITNICMTGEPTFTYNTYAPIPYNTEPNIIKGKYVPPNNLTDYAYYNYGYFSSPTLNLLISLNPGPSSTTITDNSNATCSQQMNYDLNNISSSYAVYSITYNISSSTFTNTDLQYQILDLFYLYETLSNTFTTDFKNSCFYNNTKTNLAQMVIDYCSNSGNMSFSLCSNDFLPFSFLNQSPCIENIGYCKQGLLKFCSNSSNYNNEQCLQYYSKSYDGTQLDTDTQVMLKDTCGKIYNSTQDKSTLDENFWTVCGCYLPQEVYSQYLEKNNMDESIIGYPQCWYVPCITSSVLPSTKPKCPSNDITNCIQYKYITVKNTDTNQEQTSMTESTLNNCSNVNYNYITTKPPVQENFEIFQEKNNKRVNIIFIILIFVLVIMFLLKKFLF